MAVGTAPPTAAAPPCRWRLRDRIQSELQVVGGLLKKAEALVARAKDVNGGAAAEGAPHSEACALPRRGKKSGRYLLPETLPEATAATDGATSPKKRRKTSPIVEVELIEPTMPKAKRDRLYGLLSSLSAEMPLPPHIVGLMRSQCCCIVDPNGDDMEVNLGSTKDAALSLLLSLLEEFAQQQSKIKRLAEEQEPPKIDVLDASDVICRSSICELEEGEINEDGRADMDMDICGGVSLLFLDEVQFSPLPKQQEDDELIDSSGGVSLLSPPAKQQEDEFIGHASPVAVDKLPQSETPSSSSNSSSSSSSGASSGSSSSARSGSSGSSCSGSSSSSSGSDSDSDSDDDGASSNPDSSDLPTEVAAKPLEQYKVTEHDTKLKLTERAASPVTEMQQVTEQGTRAEAKPLEQQEIIVHDKKLITEREASPNTQMRELIARAQERQKLRRELERKTARELERKRAREQLQELKRTAWPVYGSIDPRDMKQLGISQEVEYIVSPMKSRDSVRRRGGGLLQKLGFFLKAEC